MEKSTLPKWLDQAARNVTRASSGNLRILRTTPDAQGNANSPPAATEGRYALGLHSHGCIEACFVLRGTCRLHTSEATQKLGPGHFAVVPPNVLHCEGWHRADRGYRLLWIVVIGDSCSTFTSTYTPSRGWVSGVHISAAATASDTLRRALQLTGDAPAPESPGAAHLLRGALVAILGDLIQSLSEGAPPKQRGPEWAAQVKKYIDLHYADPLTVASLAALFRLSPNYLNSRFSKHQGMGIRAYLLQRRLESARRMLRRGDCLVKEAAYSVGFTDPLYFSRLFRQRFGHPPSDLRDPRSE